MKQLLLVFALFTLFSCDKEEITKSNVKEPGKFYVRLENTSSIDATFTVDIYTNSTGKTPDNKYIKRGLVVSKLYESLLTPDAGKGKMYVQATRPSNNDGEIKSTYTVNKNGMTLDFNTGAKIITISYDPNL